MAHVALSARLSELGAFPFVGDSYGHISPSPRSRPNVLRANHVRRLVHRLVEDHTEHVALRDHRHRRIHHRVQTARRLHGWRLRSDDRSTTRRARVPDDTQKEVAMDWLALSDALLTSALLIWCYMMLD